MTLVVYDAPQFQPQASIEEQFGEDVAFVLVVYYSKRALQEGGEGDVEVFKSPQCKSPRDSEFPKECVTLHEPTQITVIAWEENPACKGCTVNGKWYPCCPI